MPTSFSRPDGSRWRRLMKRPASLAGKAGYTLLIISDRGVNKDYAPIPSLLALAAVHNLLVQEETRTQVALITESGEPREVIGDATLFAECCRRLAVVDNGGANATVISPVDRENIWAEVYERLKRAHPVAHSN